MSKPAYGAAEMRAPTISPDRPTRATPACPRGCARCWVICAVTDALQAGDGHAVVSTLVH